MSLLPTLLRAGVLCLVSMVPENSSLDSVVFCASLQILLGVVYVTLFYITSAMVRVLTSRGALVDPTEPAIDFNADNLSEFGDDNDFTPYPVHTSQQWPTGHQLKTDEFGDRGVALIVRAGRGVRRQVHRIVSRVTGDGMPTVHLGHGDCDEHSPARRGSVQDHSSDKSDTTEASDAAGVGLTRHTKPSRYTKSWVQKSMDLTRVSMGPVIDGLDTHTLDEKPIDKDWVVHNTQLGQTQGASCRLRPPADVSESHDHIYTDVYGLGFSAFVLAYTIDCELNLKPRPLNPDP